jgi:ribosomal protein L33
MHTNVYNIYIIENILLTTCMAHLYTTTQHNNIHEKFKISKYCIIIVNNLKFLMYLWLMLFSH